jgi:hypothetical protein
MLVIAEAAASDSATMKYIALITVFFLPATFLAVSVLSLTQSWVRQFAHGIVDNV